MARTNYSQMTELQIVLLRDEAGAAGDSKGRAYARRPLSRRGVNPDVDAWTLSQVLGEDLPVQNAHVGSGPHWVL